MLERGLILSYHQMCDLEGRGLQQGMHYRTTPSCLPTGYSMTSCQVSHPLLARNLQ